VPSHIFEFFSRDPASLALISRHSRLGTPLPPHDAARAAALISSMHHTSALDLQEQVVAALGDLRLHDEHLTGAATGAVSQHTRTQPQPVISHTAIPATPVAQASQLNSSQVDTHAEQQLPAAASTPPAILLQKCQEVLSPPANSWVEQDTSLAREAFGWARAQGSAVVGAAWPAVNQHQGPVLIRQVPDPNGQFLDPSGQSPSFDPSRQLNQGTEPAGGSSADLAAGSVLQDNVRPAGQAAERVQAQAQSQQSLTLEPLVTLEGLSTLESLAVIGGAAHVYVLPKLIAAAVWKQAEEEGEAPQARSGWETQGQVSK
jgi:hypothetical protein